MHHTCQTWTPFEAILGRNFYQLMFWSQKLKHFFHPWLALKLDRMSIYVIEASPNELSSRRIKIKPALHLHTCPSKQNTSRYIHWRCTASIISVTSNIWDKVLSHLSTYKTNIKYNLRRAKVIWTINKRPNILMKDFSSQKILK